MPALLGPVARMEALGHALGVPQGRNPGAVQEKPRITQELDPGYGTTELADSADRPGGAGLSNTA